MKRITTILLLIMWSQIVTATHYYFANSGSDANSGTSTGSPFKTIAKFNTLALVGDDTASFNGGDVFNDAQMKMPNGGSAGHPITINSYGTGNALISGFTSISSGSWASAGGGLYTVTVGSLSSLRMVTLDGYYQQMSIYPKNGRYFNITSSSHANSSNQDTINNASTSTNNDSLLSHCPTLTGTPEVVWRPFNWVLWRGSVTGQTSTAIYYTPFTAPAGGSTEQPANGQGFFVQNSPVLCTALGDWAYNNSTHVLTMYFGGGGPTGHTVQASTIDTLVNLNNKNYITFDGVTVQGANSYNLYSGGSTNIIFKNGNISFAGLYGINGQGASTTWTISGNTVRCINSNGTYQAFSATGWTLTGNTFDSIGAFRGMGGSGEIQYIGLRGRSSNDIEKNTFKHCGYIPLMWDGINNTVQQNVVDTFGFVKDDAGGIYCDANNMSGSIVNLNIIHHALTAAPGTGTQTDNYGIYLDDGASNVTIQNNTASFCSNAGMYCHNCHDNTFTSNTFFNNNFSQDRYINDASTIANITFKKNIEVSDTNTQFITSTSAGTSGYFAARDTNYFARGTDTTNDFRKDGVAVGFNTWKTVSVDPHSTHMLINPTANILYKYNMTANSIEFSLGAQYMDLLGNLYNGFITVQPYGSAVLYYVAPLAGSGSGFFNYGAGKLRF